MAKTIHGMSHTRLYRIWNAMKQRCENPKAISFPRYGGRGIAVCTEWKNSFEAFRNWAMANGYSDKLTIDRINNDGNYEPSNCRWVTNKTIQAITAFIHITAKHSMLCNGLKRWVFHIICFINDYCVDGISKKH